MPDKPVEIREHGHYQLRVRQRDIEQYGKAAHCVPEILPALVHTGKHSEVNQAERKQKHDNRKAFEHTELRVAGNHFLLIHTEGKIAPSRMVKITALNDDLRMLVCGKINRKGSRFRDIFLFVIRYPAAFIEDLPVNEHLCCIGEVFRIDSVNLARR